MTVRIITGDCREVLRSLADESVHCCVTSPPYFGLRDYGIAGQLGSEPSPDEFVAALVSVFGEVRRVLRDDGTLWLNLGDSYAGSGKGGNPSDSQYQKQATNRGSEQFVKSKRMERGSGRWGGGSLPQYVGLKPKDLIGIPWRVAFALQADGWWLRQDIIWSKPNPMPESVTDRCTKAHEYIFLLSKSAKYYYDADAIAEPAIYSGLSGQDDSGFKSASRFDGKHSETGYRTNKKDKQRGHGRRHAGFNDRWDQMERAEQCSGMRNKRDVWEVATKPYSEAHFATFPPALIEPCILAGCPKDGTVLDPFGGAGTTALVADRLQRNSILVELNPDYADMARARLTKDAPLFAETAAA